MRLEQGGCPVGHNKCCRIGAEYDHQNNQGTLYVLLADHAQQYFLDRRFAGVDPGGCRRKVDVHVGEVKHDRFGFFNAAPAHKPAW